MRLWNIALLLIFFSFLRRQGRAIRAHKTCSDKTSASVTCTKKDEVCECGCFGGVNCACFESTQAGSGTGPSCTKTCPNGSSAERKCRSAIATAVRMLYAIATRQMIVCILVMPQRACAHPRKIRSWIVSQNSASKARLQTDDGQRADGRFDIDVGQGTQARTKYVWDCP